MTAIEEQWIAHWQALGEAEEARREVEVKPNEPMETDEAECPTPH